MKWLLSILLSMGLTTATSQVLPEIELPYESVTKEIIRDEQFTYYCDENFVYMFFKPSLVGDVEIATYIKGRLVSIVDYKVRPNHDMLEGRRRSFEMLMIVTIRDQVYLVRVPAK